MSERLVHGSFNLHVQISEELDPLLHSERIVQLSRVDEYEVNLAGNFHQPPQVHFPQVVSALEAAIVPSRHLYRTLAARRGSE